MRFQGAIFDVDGVLLDTPHEQAWRRTFDRLMAGPWREIMPHTRYRPGAFTAEVYQAEVAGKPRDAGARAALAYFGVPDPDGARARQYADEKQREIITLAQQGEFRAFDDAIRFLLRVKHAGLKLAAASSSKNANMFLAQIPVPAEQRSAKDGHQLSEDDRLATAKARRSSSVVHPASLLDMFDANVCGWDFARGKPDPEIFLTAAAQLGLPPAACFVVEDAASGIEAARAGGMFALGVARLGDEALLRAAGADLVVTSLDEVDLTNLLQIG
jgi:beta-phosphoglucomutase-like phosphatase (HAD superfamily)